MYAPREDSYFFSNFLKDYLNEESRKLKILDMGSGSGILAKTCIEMGFDDVLAADIDVESVIFLKKNKIKAVNSDLFSNIQCGFDIILFNAPYLPASKYDKEKDTTGGEKGYEAIISFLRQAKSHLKKNARILLLYSSYSKPRTIKKMAEGLGFCQRLLASKKLFFEKLFIYEFSLKK